MTPEEAWPHIKALWPGARRMEKNDGNVGCFIIDDETGFEGHLDFDADIDWPEGVTQWPPPEPQYRRPRMPDDFGKEIEVRGYCCKKWETVGFGGIAYHKTDEKWIDSMGLRWIEARIRVDDDGWKPMESAPKDRVLVLKMGETEIQGRWSHGSRQWISTGAEPRSHIWDRDNQPTAWKEIE